MTSDANTDRFLMALGGFIGFGGSFLSALRTGGGDISSALLRASIGMIIGAVLMKLLLSLAHSAFRDARRTKILEMAKKELAQETPPAAPAPTTATVSKPATARAARQKP